MAGLDSPALSAARAKVATALAEFTQVIHDERVGNQDITSYDLDDEGSIFVVGFAVELEYLVPPWVAKEITGNVQIVPDDQSPGYSRGLYERGADQYRK